jgi:Holliday junction resolvasome RuvABC endonuclease subunit
VLILSFDQSITRTGYAVYEYPHHKTMILGSFTSRPETDMAFEDKCGLFCDGIERVIKEYAPRGTAIYGSWEAAQNIIRQYPRKGGADLAGPLEAQPVTVTADQLILHDIQGHIRHAFRARRIPYEAITAKSWRAGILKNGNLGKDEAKQKARDLCTMLGIKFRNHDEAEAACIAMFTGTTQKYRAVKMGLAA